MKNNGKVNMNGVIIAAARKEHIFAISELTRGENLRFRSPEEIYSILSNFLVALDENGGILACVGAKFYDFDAEIIALRTADCWQGRGLAKTLLKRKVCELRRWKNIRIFALTTKPIAEKLFFPMNFIRVGIQLFSSKVLMDCAECPKNRMEGSKHLCNETAVLYRGE